MTIRSGERERLYLGDGYLKNGQEPIRALAGTGQACLEKMKNKTGGGNPKGPKDFDNREKIFSMKSPSN